MLRKQANVTAVKPVQGAAANADAIEVIRAGFEKLGYITNPQISTSIFLAQNLEKPLLVEGPPGVGKTELAIATSNYLGLPLVRLQCYEGLDESKALYEWKYGKQLLYTQILRETLSDVLQGAQGLAQSMDRLHKFSDVFFSEQFLEERPLMRAMRAPEGAVLLIDELDKADQEFESFLLELLSEYQITIPEIGTMKAKVKPVVFLTSNNTRELSDALKRRCLHLYIPFPDAALERRIIAARVPDISARLRNELVAFVQELRALDLKKLPAVSETIDWARTLLLLHANTLEPEMVRNTLSVILKFQDDIEAVEAQLGALTEGALKAAERPLGTV
ncbi:MAG TPA: ATPase [Alphaproteobacteria bacterium]|nr:ATPase [Alphaproteobacteria bacterium]